MNHFTKYLQVLEFKLFNFHWNIQLVVFHFKFFCKCFSSSCWLRVTSKSSKNVSFRQWGLQQHGTVKSQIFSFPISSFPLQESRADSWGMELRTRALQSLWSTTIRYSAAAQIPHRQSQGDFHKTQSKLVCMADNRRHYLSRLDIPSPCKPCLSLCW